MDGVAKTAYYCCGVRAADAATPHPICGDTLAQRFMDDDGKAISAKFAELKPANASNIARARIIDDWLREKLRATPQQRVILLGAGFDTRAYRLQGGRWTELDQPALIALKNGKLPVSEAPNPLERIAIDFAKESLVEKLKPFAGETPIVVMEGVSMYLSPPQLRATLGTLRQSFPKHTLICDLMAARFSRRYGGPISKVIESLGGRFAEHLDDPAKFVRDAGYRELARVSMVNRARELGAFKIPGFMLNLFLRTLRDGFCAYQFEAA
jgi:methyltransferase (TIGR00027 family)